MVKGVIGTYTEDGWPVLEGKTVRLVGIQPVAPERMQKFLAWVTAPSGFLECEPIGDGFRCLTNSNEDVAQSLLLNGQARSAPDANEIYLAAEREAQQAHKGIWK
jgi:endonuclease YncB( thermonuclease family)